MGLPLRRNQELYQTILALIYRGPVKKKRRHGHGSSHEKKRCDHSSSARWNSISNFLLSGVGGLLICTVLFITRFMVSYKEKWAWSRDRLTPYSHGRSLGQPQDPTLATWPARRCMRAAATPQAVILRRSCVSSAKCVTREWVVLDSVCIRLWTDLQASELKLLLIKLHQE